MATFKIRNKLSGEMVDIVNSGLFNALLYYRVDTTATFIDLPTSLKGKESLLDFVIVQEPAMKSVNNNLVVSDKYKLIKNVKISSGKVTWEFAPLGSELPAMLIIGEKFNG